MDEIPGARKEGVRDQTPDVLKAMGKSKTVELPNGNRLERKLTEVAARQMDAYSFEKLVERPNV